MFGLDGTFEFQVDFFEVTIDFFFERFVFFEDLVYFLECPSAAGTKCKDVSALLFR